MRLRGTLAFVIVALSAATAGAQLLPGQAQPKKLYSNGDSITRAFDAGRALYDGRLLGQPFRSVVKTFQVRVWRELLVAWAALPDVDQRSVTALAGNGLDARSIFLPHPSALC
jgi:hypothetical protein